MRSLESQTLKLLELITTNEKVRSLESQKSLELITITKKVRSLESQTPLENIVINNKVRNVESQTPLENDNDLQQSAECRVTSMLQCLVRNARILGLCRRALSMTTLFCLDYTEFLLLVTTNL